MERIRVISAEPSLRQQRPSPTYNLFRREEKPDLYCAAPKTGRCRPSCAARTGHSWAGSVKQRLCPASRRSKPDQAFASTAFTCSWRNIPPWPEEPAHPPRSIAPREMSRPIWVAGAWVACQITTDLKSADAEEFHRLRLCCRLRGRGCDICRHGVISAGAPTPVMARRTSRRLRRPHIPTTAPTAPLGACPTVSRSPKPTMASGSGFADQG